MPTTTTELLIPTGPFKVLQTVTSVSIPGQDLFRNYVGNVFAVPGQIDLDRFQAAVQAAVARNRPAAGRLKREGDNWNILLTDSPIPLRVIRMGSEDAEARRGGFPFKDDFVIQDFMQVLGYLNTEDAPKMTLEGEGTEPLLAFKLTYWEGGTVVGTYWCHVLGDAAPMYDFTLMLSRLYEDLDTSEDKLPLAPSFYRHVFPSPFRKGAPTENMLPRMPHLSNDLPMSEVMGRYASNDAASDHVQFRISGASTQKMLEVAKAGEDVHLSTQDAMSAYFVTLLNRIHSDKVSTVINAVNFRTDAEKIETAAPWTQPSAVGNAILMMYSEPIPNDGLTSVPVVAQTIRQSINLAKQHDFIEKWHSFASFLMPKCSNSTDRFYYFGPEDNEATINSNYRYDWTQCHFGYPNQTRFYCHWTILNYFRIFVANPRPNASPHQARKPDACVSCRILKEHSAEFISLFKTDYPDTIFQEQI